MNEPNIETLFRDAHASLVYAAKIAHLEKHPNAQDISKLIDCVQDLFEKFVTVATDKD